MSISDLPNRRELFPDTSIIGKIYNYLETANYNELPQNTPINNPLFRNTHNIYYTYSKEDTLSVLHNYFTDEDLKLILEKIIECNPKYYKHYFYSYTLQDLGVRVSERKNRLMNKIKIKLTTINLRIIQHYLHEMQFSYKRNQPLDRYLCGFMETLKEHGKKNRGSAIEKASITLNKTLPSDILRYTSEYLNETDGETFTKRHNGGKTKRKKNKKRKTKKCYKQRR
jgi:hypothetical protein